MTTFRAMMLGTAAVGLAAATFAAPAVAGDRIAASGNDKVKLTVYGHINRSVMIADDGDETDVYFTDNAASQSRFGFKGAGKISEDLSAGAHFEFGAQSNLSSSVNQTTEGSAVSFQINERLAYVYFDSKKFGKLSLGQINTATNGAAEVDISGSNYLGTYNDTKSAFGNHYFVVDTTHQNVAINPSARGPQVGSVFDSYDGRSRQDGIRYDTPKFAGFQISASAEQGGAYHVAGRYSGEFAGIKVAAALGGDWLSAIDTSAGTGLESDVTGSISAIHSSGISLTFAGAKANYKSNSTKDDPSNIYVKLGYKANLTDLGATAFGIDYQKTSDKNVNGQDAENFGIGVVQYIDSAATQLYANLKMMNLDDNGTTSYEDLTVAVIGARVKF